MLEGDLSPSIFSESLACLSKFYNKHQFCDNENNLRHNLENSGFGILHLIVEILFTICCVLCARICYFIYLW